jgi:hypothetical protein
MEIVCIYAQSAERNRLFGNFDWQLHISRSVTMGFVTYRKQKRRPRTAICWA